VIDDKTIARMERAVENGQRLEWDDVRSLLQHVVRYEKALLEIIAGWTCSCYPRLGECPPCIAKAALGDAK